jgi:formylglycine-generating enzyme required for sulfatase activity
MIEYRRHVDQAMLDAIDGLSVEAIDLVMLGCHHEEQHQELLLSDVLHLLAQNPLNPALLSATPVLPGPPAPALEWIEGRTGSVQIGQAGRTFAFDSEGPRHTSWLSPHALSGRLVTNGEWMQRIGLVLGSVSSTYFCVNGFLPGYMSGNGHPELVSTALKALSLCQIPTTLTRTLIRRG